MQSRAAGRSEMLVHGGTVDGQRELKPGFRAGCADAQQTGAVRGVHCSYSVFDAGQFCGEGKLRPDTKHCRGLGQCGSLGGHSAKGGRDERNTLGGRGQRLRACRPNGSGELLQQRPDKGRAAAGVLHERAGGGQRELRCLPGRATCPGLHPD